MAECAFLLCPNTPKCAPCCPPWVFNITSALAAPFGNTSVPTIVSNLANVSGSGLGLHHGVMAAAGGAGLYYLRNHIGRLLGKGATPQTQVEGEKED